MNRSSPRCPTMTTLWLSAMEQFYGRNNSHFRAGKDRITLEELKRFLEVQEHLLRQPYVPYNVHFFRWIEDAVSYSFSSFLDIGAVGVKKLIITNGLSPLRTVRRQEEWRGSSSWQSNSIQHPTNDSLGLNGLSLSQWDFEISSIFGHLQYFPIFPRANSVRKIDQKWKCW